MFPLIVTHIFSNWFEGTYEHVTNLNFSLNAWWHNIKSLKKYFRVRMIPHKVEWLSKNLEYVLNDMNWIAMWWSCLLWCDDRLYYDLMYLLCVFFIFILYYHYDFKTHFVRCLCLIDLVISLWNCGYYG